MQYPTSMSSSSGNDVGAGIEYKEFGNVQGPDDVVPYLAVGNAMPSPNNVITASAPCQQVVIIQAPKMQRSFERYSAKWSFICGAIQIAAGIVSIILGIANALTCAVLGIIGYGIWCGVLFIVSGSFGIASSRKKISCMIISHMVLSVISAVAAATQFSLGVFTATYDMYSYSPPTIGCYYTIGQYQTGDDIGPDGAVTTDALLAVIAILEGVVAIIGSAVSCKVICCSANFVPTQGNAISGFPYGHPQQQPQPQPYGPGSVTQAQVVYYVNQPIAPAAGQPQQQLPVSYQYSNAYGY